MDCRKFQKEVEGLSEPPKEFRGHMEQCLDCSAFVESDIELTTIFRALPKAAAPAQFEYGVRSGIAKKRTVGAKLVNAAKLAVPVAAVFLVAAVWSYNAGLIGNQSEAPQMVVQDAKDLSGSENERPLSQDDVEKSAPAESGESVESDIPLRAVPVEKKDTEATKDKANSDARKDDGPKVMDSTDGDTRSLDFAVEEPTSMNPPGIEPHKPIDPKLPKQTRRFTGQEVLNVLGIATSSKNGRLSVSSVAKSSIAERAGIQNGDVLISIDGKKFGSSAFASGTARGRVLKVIRNGKELIFNIGAGN